MKAVSTIFTMLVLVLLVNPAYASETAGSSEDVTETTLEAEIVISGLDLLPASGDGEASPQSTENWNARLIDPTESLDEIPLPITDYGLSYRGFFDYTDRMVAVMFKVPVDLAGGDAESTSVDVLIPVELGGNDITQVDAAVEFSQLDGEWVVDLDYTVKRGETTRCKRCRLFWADGMLAYDEDGDGVFETMESNSDPDRNCLAGEQKWLRKGPRDGHGRDEGGGRRDGSGKEDGGSGHGNGNSMGRQQGGTS